MTDLVTGGAGFIGRAVVDYLLRDGRNVRVLDRDPEPGLPPEVEIITGSIADDAVLQRAMNGIERVFHTAGDPRLWARDAEAFTAANLDTTRAVLDCAERADIARIVMTSTAAIHFTPRHGGAPTLADMPGAYARSKFLSEQEALDAARRGLPVVIVNPCLPIGPGDRRITPPTRMILDFLNGKTLAYLDFVLRVIDVGDLAGAYAAAAESGEIGERYFLGSAPLHLSELLAMLELVSGQSMPRRRVPYALAHVAALVSEFVSNKITGRPPVAPLAGVRLARRQSMPTGLKEARDLGVELRPVEQSLAEEVAWLAGQGYLTRPLRPSDPTR